MDLKNIKKSITFYNDRYSKGYMDDWPLWKKKRISEVIKNLKLPRYGKVLDFGCGNGIFSQVIKQVLPEWDVYGTDISIKAVNKARRKYPQCIFYNLFGKRYKNIKYDFIFTHHVLEHVYDISKTWEQISSFTKRRAGILHILPCGNKGSLEHKVCLLRKNGINKQNGRFFFEDEGHLRRLDTQKMNFLASKNGFTLERQFYSGQYYGSLKFLASESYKFILDFTSSSETSDTKAKLKLYILRIQLILLSIFKKNAFSLSSFNYKKRGIKIIRSLFILPFSLVFKLIDCYCDKKADIEWEIRKEDKVGSEMYLYYTKTI